jgi:hypothetical protein
MNKVSGGLYSGLGRENYNSFWKTLGEEHDKLP